MKKYDIQSYIDNYPRSDEFNTLLFYHGPFSQWWYSPFEVDGITYNCTEQYMMAAKARLFGDNDVESMIMACDGPAHDQAEFTRFPRRQKELGRTVKGFVKEEWDLVARQLVRDGNVAKFTQDEELRVGLLSTSNYLLVEASPYDPIWGIKMDIDDDKSFNPANWRGTNWLGHVLTEVRDIIK